MCTWGVMWRIVNSSGNVVDESILRNTSIASRTYAMRRNWLTQVERKYVQTLLDEAIQNVKMRDMKLCAGFVQHAIQSRRLSTTTLSPNVIDKFAKDGFRLLQRMLNRHAGYKNLPCPLRGKALERKAVAVGLVQRTMIVRVDVQTLRKECNMAEGRRKMKMPEERNRQTVQPCVDGKNKKDRMCASHQSTSDRDWGSGHHTRVERV